MKKEEKTLTIKHKEGEPTKYVVETYEVHSAKKNGPTGIVVIRDSPENKGTKFSDLELNEKDKITEEQGQELKKKYDLEPNEINVYREQADGKFEKIHFRYLGWGTEQPDKEQRWTAEGNKGHIYTKEELAKITNGSLAKESEINSQKRNELNTSFFKEQDRSVLQKELKPDPTR